ncbi:MAG: hypothetical protein JOY93_06005 [Acidobacteriales bacterium]|nr:hypothetical protein [Terriglobales bacterium]
MAIVVVGGHSRSVGKTRIVAGLIAALPEYRWTALKITQYGHGICSLNGGSCHCATDDHSWAISEEKNRSGGSDTSRFLDAGAARVWWVRTEQGRLAEAVPAIRRRLAESRNVLIESNSILRFVQPSLYLSILDPATADFKSSAQEFLDRADAVILHRTINGGKSKWTGVSFKAVAHKPAFEIHPPEFLTPEIVAFVRNRLEVAA